MTETTITRKSIETALIALDHEAAALRAAGKHIPADLLARSAALQDELAATAAAEPTYPGLRVWNEGSDLVGIDFVK